MQTFNSLYVSLKLQVFFFLICVLAKCCTYAVPINIAHLLNKPLLFAMQTINSLNASLRLQVFFCQNPAFMLYQLTLHFFVEQTIFICYANNQITICLTEIASVFLLICGLAKCCTYAVAVNIAHLLNKPFLFPQTFTS